MWFFARAATAPQDAGGEEGTAENKVPCLWHLREVSESLSDLTAHDNSKTGIALRRDHSLKKAHRTAPSPTRHTTTWAPGPSHVSVGGQAPTPLSATLKSTALGKPSPFLHMWH